MTRRQHRNFGSPQAIAVVLKYEFIGLPVVETAGHSHAPGVMIVIIKKNFVICKIKKWREGRFLKT